MFADDGVLSAEVGGSIHISTVSALAVCARLTACGVLFVRQVGGMAEKAAGGPVATITPVQQMMASGTGALLTSVFGGLVS